MKYPVGIQDFRVLREGGNVYVDKTEQIFRILSNGKYFFLSRPRRFGKSLLLSTIKEMYAGSRELFHGLWVEHHWDWSKTNPVIWLKFASQGVGSMGLEPAIHNMLDGEAQGFGITLTQGSFDQKFKELIRKIAERGCKAVLLIDEYDKPIIDYLDDMPRASANRDTLKIFFSVLKDCDPYLETVFITGVSAFSKVSIFSDLNNLENLTLSPWAYTLLGLTHEELERFFPDQMAVVDVEQMQRWYNGYSWDGLSKVYNPFSILRFFKDGQKYDNYWFETGTPTFLMQEMRKQHFFNVEGLMASPLVLKDFELGALNPVTVLFQAGYLTLKGPVNRVGLYPLGFPNQEVRDAFGESLLNVYAQDNIKGARVRLNALLTAFQQSDLPAVMQVINATFASIPYDLWQKENEHFYHALIHLTFSLLGSYVQSEVHTAQGRCDAVVQTSDHIYVFEFKLDQSAEDALGQIRQRGYMTPFSDSAKKKIALGVDFSSKEKRIAEWKSEEVFD